LTLPAANGNNTIAIFSPCHIETKY